MESPSIESAGEKIKTKAEINQDITDLEAEIQTLSQKRSDLKSHLESLIHKYEQGGEDLESFKKAKELLEKRIESPTMSDKLKQRFSSLFGEDGVIEDKTDFLEKRSGTEEAVAYREEGEDLRGVVSGIAEEKDTLRELMEEDLSFRGGTVEGEERPPREESIEKINEALESIDEDIKNKSEAIVPMRDEVYEAWKRENPEEAQKLAEQEQAEKDDEQKVAQFESFLKTSPSNDEIFDILENSFNYPGTKFNKKLVEYSIGLVEDNYRVIERIGVFLRNNIDVSNEYIAQCDKKFNTRSHKHDFVSSYREEEFDFDDVAVSILNHLNSVIVENGIEITNPIYQKIERYFVKKISSNISQLARKIYQRSSRQYPNVKPSGYEEVIERSSGIAVTLKYDGLPLHVQKEIELMSGLEFPKLKIDELTPVDLYEYLKKFEYSGLRIGPGVMSEATNGPYRQLNKLMESAITEKYGEIDNFISKLVELKGARFLEEKGEPGGVFFGLVGVEQGDYVVNSRRYKSFSNEALMVIAPVEVKKLVDRFNLDIDNSWEKNLARLKKSISYAAGGEQRLINLITEDLSQKIKDWEKEWEEKSANKEKLKQELNS